MVSSVQEHGCPGRKTSPWSSTSPAARFGRACALCLMGVLETRQGDGTYVTSLDASLLLAPMAFLVDLGTEADAFHLQAVRRVLETEAAGRRPS